MKVVIATDGSSAADKAVQLTRKLEWPAGTELRAITVVVPLGPVVAADWGLPADPDSEPEDEAKKAGQAILNAAVQQLDAPQTTVSQQITYGRPATEILEAARDFGAELIMVGSRGHGTIASMVLGSVSAEVADHAHCPVLVARNATIERAVLGVDGSTFARTAEEVVASWPIFEGTEVEVTSVAGLPLMANFAIGAYVPPEAALDEATLGISEHGRVCAEAAQRLHAEGRHTSTRVVQGDAATELICVARDTRADLIVVGTHGRSGISRAVFGSVARNVMLHAAVLGPGGSQGRRQPNRRLGLPLRPRQRPHDRHKKRPRRDFPARPFDSSVRVGSRP